MNPIDRQTLINKVEDIFNSSDSNKELYDTEELQDAFKAGAWDAYVQAMIQFNIPHDVSITSNPKQILPEK